MSWRKTDLLVLYGVLCWEKDIVGDTTHPSSKQQATHLVSWTLGCQKKKSVLKLAWGKHTGLLAGKQVTHYAFSVLLLRKYIVKESCRSACNIGRRKHWHHFSFNAIHVLSHVPVQIQTLLTVWKVALLTFVCDVCTWVFKMKMRLCYTLSPIFKNMIWTSF